jgi:type III pantothenate kinase
MNNKIKYIDIGNTNTKILASNIINIYSTLEIANGLISLEEVFKEEKSTYFMSSVVPSVSKKIEEYLKKKGINIFNISGENSFSFKHELKGVGVDRLLSVEGALDISKPPFFVIDAGTAITVDFVDLLDGVPVFKGGVIIPGFRILLDSLNKKTSQLPAVEVFIPNNFIGEDTTSAINNGVCLNISYGIQGLISAYKQKNDINDIKVIITGGSGKFLYDLLTNKDLSIVDSKLLDGVSFIQEKNLVFNAMKKIGRNLEDQENKKKENKKDNNVIRQ